MINYSLEKRDITRREQAEDALQRSMRRFELLAAMSADLLQSPEPHKLVESVCRKVMEHLDCHIFFNYLMDETSGRLHANSYAGIPEEDAGGKEWLEPGQGVCGCVVRDGCRIVAERIQTTDDERTTFVKAYGVDAYACHPMLQPGGKVFGTLSFGTKSRETFSDEDLSLMKAVTDQVTVALIRIRDEQALRRMNNELELRIRERTAELARANDELQEEIAVRKQAVEGLARLNCLYSVLSKVNEAIVRISDPEALYQQVCRVAVEEGLFKMAWIGLIDADTQEIKPVVSYGDSGGYLRTVKMTASDNPEGRGPTGRAAFEGKYDLCGDIERDGRMLPWRDKALGQGFRSSAAFPLQSGGAVIGALTVYSRDPQFFGEVETSLFTSLMDDITFALDTMAIRRRRQKAEQALQKASAYNRSLLEAGLDPLVAIAADGKITDVNAATEAATGYSRKELIGTDFSDYFLDREKAKAGYQQAFREGSVKDYALEIRHKDGQTTPVVYNASVYSNEDGIVSGVIAAARDITERRETERRNGLTNELLKLYTRKFSRKEYLDVAVELIRGWSDCRHTGIRIADRNGNIPYESCVGYNRNFLETEQTLSVKNDQCVCTRVVVGSPEQSELQDMTANGSFYCNETVAFIGGLNDRQRGLYRGVCMSHGGFLSLGVVPIRHGDRILGAIHIADERSGMLSFQKIEFIEQLAFIIGEALFRFGIEEELRELNRDLERRVNERTAQLESANKELEAFAYSVSHDLRTPLRSIDGFSNAILEDYADRLGDTGKDYFNRIQSAASKMGQLIDGLLNLSRLTRGQLTRSAVNLTKLAAGIADELKNNDPHRDAEFIIANDMSANGDPVMIRSLFENLLSNAWKFTGKREKTWIEIGLKPGKDEQVFFVRDNGAGFDMAYANKLFTAFNRLHSTNDFPGIGIGLATVQRIVHRHGGRIWAEGEVDKGATIYFTLS